MKTFSIKEAVSRGWEIFKKNKKLLVLATVAIFAIQIVLNIFVSAFEGYALFAFVMSLVAWGFSILTTIGYTKIMLKLSDNEGARVGEVLSYGRLFWKYFGVSTIVGLIVAIPIVISSFIFVTTLFGVMTQSVPPVVYSPGGSFLITLGIFIVGVIVAMYLSVRYAFATVMVVDSEDGVIDTIKKSYKMTKGISLKVFALFVVIAGINILGAMVLIVGLLVSIPVSSLAFIHVYRKLSGGQEVSHEGTAPVESELAPEMV